MTLQAIRYERGRLEILDQLLLPDTSRYITIKNAEDGWQAIRKMQVCAFILVLFIGCLVYYGS